MLFSRRKNVFFRYNGKKSAKKFGGFKKNAYLCTRLQEVRAFSSVGLEHLPYKQRVGGSNPSTPTKERLQQKCCDLFSFSAPLWCDIC